MRSPLWFPFAAVAATALLLGCRDSTGAGMPEIPLHEQVGYGAGTVAIFHCTASPASGDLTCVEPSPSTSAGIRPAILGQNQIKLRSSNVAYDLATRIYSFDVTLQNLLGEPIGTPDGTTAVGSKVFYHEGPSATAYVTPGDTGTVFSANPDGRLRFTRVDQPYHYYPEILAPQATSAAKRWEIHCPPTVQNFAFVLYVFTARPGEAKVAPVAPNLVPEWLYAPENLGVDLAGMSGRYLRDVLTVVFKPDATLEERQAALDHVGGTVVGGVRMPYGDGGYYVRIATDGTAHPLLNARARLEALPQVQGAAVEFVADGSALDYRVAHDSGDYASWTLDPASAPRLNWPLEAIQAPDAWGCETGSPNLHVAVADIGFHLSVNPDLTPNVAQANFHYQWPDLNLNHGTQVSSIVAARGNNGVGMTGVMWNAHMTLWELGTNVNSQPLQNGGWYHTSMRIAMAAFNGARVVNVSYGYNTAGNPPTAADSVGALNAAHSLGMWIPILKQRGFDPLFVVTAGNEGYDAKWNGYPQLVRQYPDNVIAVGAAEHSGSATGGHGGRPFRRWTGSNSGDLVQIVAPGRSVGALDGRGLLLVHAGATSQAAPVVTGVAGLILSFDPGLGAGEVKRLLIEGGRRAGNFVNNPGGAADVPMVNAYESLKAAAERPGARLCGNRVWADNGVVYAERAGGAAEALFSVGVDAVEVNPLHGGSTIYVYPFDFSNTYRAYQRGGNGQWTRAADPGDVWLAEGSAGMVNSWLGYSHDADTLLEVNGEKLSASTALYHIGRYLPATRARTPLVSIPVGQSDPAPTTYCSREYVGADPLPTDTAQRSAYDRWVSNNGLNTNPCTYQGEVRPSATVPVRQWVAYAPRGDSAILAVSFHRIVERHGATFDCPDHVELKTAADQEFTVTVNYKCANASGTRHSWGRDLYMLSLKTASYRPMVAWNDVDWNVTGVGISETGREMVARYERLGHSFSNRWEYNPRTRVWDFKETTTNSNDCVLRYEDLRTGAIRREAECSDYDTYVFPAVISADRAPVAGTPGRVQAPRRWRDPATQAQMREALGRSPRARAPHRH